MLLFRKLCGYSLILSLVFNNVAFATQSIIELDFKDSQTPQGLHVIPRLSNVGDVSHLEIDTKHKQAAVYLKEKQEEALDEIEKNLSQGGDVPVTTKPVILQKHNIINLPWDLEPEKLTLFILNHTAWLSPLDEDGYKLEFKGMLKGGMKQWGGNQKNVYHCSKAPKKDNFCWVQGGNLYAPDSSWTGGNPGNISIISNPNYSQTGGSSGSKGTSSGGSGWQGILGQGWAEIKANGDKARDRMQKQQENLKKLSTVGQSVEIYKRPEIIIPESPFPRVQPYQPSTKESFQTGSSLEDQYSRLRVLYNMADRWEWWEIYEYAKVIGISREEIKKYNLTQRHAKSAGFSWGYFKEVTEEEVRNELKKKQQEEADREASRAGSSLYEVNPDYFERSASDAGIMPSEALHIILNPTSENFYDRTILTSRQNWLGGSENTIAFVFEDLTNKQAYKYLSQGYHKGDFPTLSDNLVSQNGAALFENVKPVDFVKQAKEANMTSIRALGILVNPTPENFYDRIMLASRQNWLGGAQDTTAFLLEGLTNEQAYKYILQGYKPWDFATLSNRIVSQRGATLFENVTPDYFVKQAEKAGMMPFQALKIIFNPAPENFYDRVMLASRQDWLGGSQDGTAFWLEGLTNKQAYQYLSQGYHKGDTATLSNKLISERWDIDTGNPFDDQVLEDWGAKNWREVFRPEESDPQIMQVNLVKDILKLIPPTTKLIQKGWQKAIQAYKGQLSKDFKLPQSVQEKLTKELGQPKLADKKIGLRWTDKHADKYVRIMKADKNSPHVSQHQDYVQIRSGGKVLNKDKNPVLPTKEFPKPSDNPESHIPYKDWIKWNHPLGGNK